MVWVQGSLRECGVDRGVAGVVTAGVWEDRVLPGSVARIRQGALRVGENSAPGCCGKRVLRVSVAQELPRNMRLSISRGLIPLAVFLLCFPLYATFVSAYLVFVSLSLNKRIPANAKPLFSLNRDRVHIPPTFVPRYPLSLERLSHPTPAFTTTNTRTV